MSEPPDAASDPTRDAQEVSRRDALKLLVAGAALSQAACIKPPGDELRPYVQTPPELSPGEFQTYATAMVLDGFATGLIVTSREGRPTKVDGNPGHAASLGATSAQHQASVLDLYDPQRAKAVTSGGLPSSWDRLFDRLLALPPGPLWLVLPPQSSTLVASLLQQIRAQRPDTQIVYSAGSDQLARYQGAQLVFGRALEVQLDLTRADVVLSLDCDLLESMPMSLRWARDFAQRRRPASPTALMNRLYMVEPMLTASGTLADHRLALPASRMTAVAVDILGELGRRGRSVPALFLTERQVTSDPRTRDFVRKVADDLARSPARSAVVVGERQPPLCHAIGHLINAALANGGATVSLTEPAISEPLGSRTLDDLTKALRAGQVGTVVIFECNPVYSAPEGEALAALLPRAALSIHYSQYANETSAACSMLAPASHYLESWGDARAWDGTHSLSQPLVRPLHGTRSLVEVLAALAGLRNPDGRVLLRERLGAGLQQQGWDLTLSSGFVAGSSFPAIAAQPAVGPGLTSALAALQEGNLEHDLELNVMRSPTIQDGRFASNAWLQELPHPITKLTWNNAAMLGPETARSLGLEDGQVVTMRVNKRALNAPVIVVPGHAERCVTLELGYGRRAADEPLADGLGVDAMALLRASGNMMPYIATNLTVTATPRHARLARTQQVFHDDGRGIAHYIDAADYRAQRGLGSDHRKHLPTLLTAQPKPGPQWAMSIDTTLCTGCGSCVVACQAENNVPVVGAKEVARGREMHWLRIDQYRFAREDHVEVVNQPMLCQHCEHAPCEYVCPVFATSHSPDGLNEMTYNRCIGTRFCSNNCPYKVRRFNWFNYTDDDGTASLQRNPNVTVRERGVMEKCTYCVQRIRGAEINARMAKRSILPGEVVTACQQACSTRAIQFSFLEDKDSEMVHWRKEPRAYAVFEELGTRPRTMYLAKVRNPNEDSGGGS